MTLDQLENTLPNGFHDAELFSLNIDYQTRQAFFDVNIDVGTGDTGRGKDEDYRPARVVFSGVQFIAVDPPAVRESDRTVPVIDSGSGQPTTAPIELPSIPANCFLSWLFVYSWNSFIRIAAQSVALEWVSGAQGS